MKVDAHTHSPRQFNNIFKVGHLTGRADYADEGTSTWQQACVLTYPIGTAQHIFRVNGRCGIAQTASSQVAMAA